MRDPRVDPKPGDVVMFGLFRLVRAVVESRTPKTVVLLIDGQDRREIHRLDSFIVKAREVLHVAAAKARKGE